MTAIKLPTLTTKQQEILKLLYKHRFLNRKQIQAFLGHKDYKTVNLWLKKLREENCVVWIYSTDFIEKTKPAVYHLGLNGIRYLRQTDEYPSQELRKRYHEADRSEGFRTRCLLLAECCIGFAAKSAGNVRYVAVTQAEYADPDSQYHFLRELGPHLYIAKREGSTQTTYLLEVFDATLPQYRVRNRLKEYVTYLTGGAWETNRDDAVPIVLLVCPTLASLIYVKRRLRSKYADELEDIEIRVTTVENIQRRVTTAEIWECV